MASPATSISLRVVEAVAASKGVDVTALPPLYEAIDPDALDALFESQSSGSGIEVEFPYAGLHIVVRGDGEVEVEVDRPPSD